MARGNFPRAILLRGNLFNRLARRISILSLFKRWERRRRCSPRPFTPLITRQLSYFTRIFFFFLLSVYCVRVFSILYYIFTFFIIFNFISYFLFTILASFSLSEILHFITEACKVENLM